MNKLAEINSSLRIYQQLFISVVTITWLQTIDSVYKEP